MVTVPRWMRDLWSSTIVGLVSPEPMSTITCSTVVEMVSLDKAGKLHLGMSVYLRKTKTSLGWAVYSQDER